MKEYGHFMKNLSRDFTATTFVVSNGRTLLLWHRKLKGWFPPGGHIETNELPEEAAVREVREETGLIVNIIGNSRQLRSVNVLHSPRAVLLENIKPGHQHIDLIYLLMNPTDILLSIAIVGIYTIIYIYLQSQFENDQIRLKLFVLGFIYATITTGILYYLIKFIAS